MSDLHTPWDYNHTQKISRLSSFFSLCFNGDQMEFKLGKGGGEVFFLWLGVYRIGFEITFKSAKYYTGFAINLSAFQFVSPPSFQPSEVDGVIPPILRTTTR